MAKIIKSTFYQNGSILDGNGVILIQSELEGFNNISKDIYHQLDSTYGKFFKMDPLSKSAFLCCEALMDGIDITVNKSKIGVFLANKSGSLDTDERYQEKTFTEQGIVSNPSIFVYTLPNIMIGEICIRHGFKGEQVMWVDQAFDADYISKYVNLLFDNNIIEACVMGWVENYNDKENVFLSWIESEHEQVIQSKDLNSNNLNSIYNQLNR